MACCFPRERPEEFPFTDFPVTEGNRNRVEELTGQIKEVRDQHALLPPVYKGACLLRVVMIALVVIGITVGIMALNGTLHTLPQTFQNINWTYAGIGLGGFAILTVGAAVIIHRVQHQIDPITQQKIGKLTGDDHWVAAHYQRDDMAGCFQGYIDTSTLDEEKSGVAYMYAYKDEQNHMGVSVNVTIFTPLHMVLAIVYNALRIVVIPFFILGCMLVEKASGTKIDPTDRAYRLSDIPIEIGKSIWRIVKAPFYALAFIFAAIYSLFDPMNGRKLGSYIERDWNEGVTRAEGFWSVRGPQPLWTCEGGRNPSGLGRNGFYLAGCWQPMAVVYYDKGNITQCTSLSRALKSNKGKPYTILTHDLLTEKHAALIHDLEQLRVE